MEIDVKNIFSKNLITISETANLAEAQALMTKKKIRHLPVTGANKSIVGILSKTDFIALRHVEIKLEALPVKKFMSSPVKAISKRASVKDVAQLFISKKISSALIADDNAIVGIVTTVDLIKLLADNIDLMNKTENMDIESIAPEGFLFPN